MPPGGSSAIVVRLLGDSTDLRRALNQAETGAEKFKRRVQLAAVGVAAAGVAIGKASVEAAATQSANFSKYEQITKKAMGEADKAIARSLNLSQASYADYFAQLSAMYQSNGIGVGKANKMAAESMKTAADAAAFGNTEVGEAVEAQLGLLKGSGELWEKYSVSIKASDISARMKEKGLDKLTGAEKKAAEAATRHALAQEKSKIFLGQAEKESGSLESRNQKLAATFEDMKAKLGAQLLPIVEKALGRFQEMADWVEQNETKTKVLAITIGSLAGTILAAAVAIKAYQVALAVARGAVTLFWAANTALNFVMNQNPIMRIVTLLALLGAALVVLWKKSDTFRAIVKGAWDAIRSAAIAAWEWIKGAAQKIGVVFGAVKRVVEGYIKGYIAVVSKIVSTIRGIPGKLGDLVGMLRQHGLDFIQGFIGGIVDKAKEIPGVIKDKVVGVAKSALHGFGLFGSPSRLTAQYGRWWAEGFVKGIDGSKAALARGQEQLLEGLKAKVDAARDLAKSIRDAFQADLAGPSGEDDKSSIFGRMAAQAKQAEAFVKKIQQLRKAGLRGDLIEQLVSAGPGSLAQANELGTNVAQANRLASRIARAGTSLGNSEARARTGINIEAPNVKVSVTLDGKELRGIVRTEVEEKNRDLKRKVTAGSGKR